jgi:hypothetical protein
MVFYGLLGVLNNRLPGKIVFYCWIVIQRSVLLLNYRHPSYYVQYVPVIYQKAVHFVESWLLRKWDPQPDLGPTLHAVLPSSQPHLPVPQNSDLSNSDILLVLVLFHDQHCLHVLVALQWFPMEFYPSTVTPHHY